jgi:dolichol kinase
VGSAAASVIGEAIGSSYVGEREQIYQRAQTLGGSIVKRFL